MDQTYIENVHIKLYCTYLFSGVIYSGVAQLPLTLNHGITYYTAVRGITNYGNVIESSSDGVLIDLTPGSVEFDK